MKRSSEDPGSGFGVWGGGGGGQIGAPGAPLLGGSWVVISDPLRVRLKGSIGIL